MEKELNSGQKVLEPHELIDKARDIVNEFKVKALGENYYKVKPGQKINHQWEDDAGNIIHTRYTRNKLIIREEVQGHGGESNIVFVHTTEDPNFNFKICTRNTTPEGKITNIDNNKAERLAAQQASKAAAAIRKTA